MKKIMICGIACLLILISFAACSFEGGVTRDEAETAISNLLGALGEDDYEAAVGFMHPEAEHNFEKMKSFDESLHIIGADLSLGVKVKAIDQIKTSLYDSKYKGSSYEFAFDAEIGANSYYIKATVVKNDSGFGVYIINFAGK